jgi:CO/xanthine dehydrogenase FAD-binding subunit
MLHEFKYVAPRSRSELLDLKAQYGGRAKLLAGGTDLLVNIRAGIFKPEFVLDAKKVEGFGGVILDKDSNLVFGPATTINDVLKDRRVRDEYPLLAACGHDLASYQIRNRATVIGNVVNASPCSDMAPALLCLNANAVITSSSGERVVSFKNFFTGVKRTVLEDNEILERIEIPSSSSGTKGEYRKLKRINGHDLGIVGVAVAIKGDTMHIGVSSAAPTPILVGPLAADIDIEKAVEAVSEAISPISDVRCTKEYREYMAGVYVRRLIKEVRG